MPQSWIRRWYLKQDNFTLWAIYVVWWVAKITTLFVIGTAIAKAIFL